MLCRGEERALALERGFLTPPNSARPWVYWFWLNGNITREGITADLEAMRRAGIGGALITANSGAVIADTFPPERRGRAYGFNTDVAKTDDHYYTGFPSYWNVVALYAYALRVSPEVTAAWVVEAFAILTGLDAEFEKK